MKFVLNNISWEELQNKSIKEKLHYFTKDGNIFDVLFAEQFNKEFLDEIYRLTNRIKLIAKTKEGKKWLGQLLSEHRVMLYFLQPSTRTFLSFTSACQILGMKCIDVRSLQTSSEMKGESFEDTIRTFSSYFDLIVMRCSDKDFAEKASFVLNKSRRPVPIINAGSGKNQHPTQALLDIFTLRKSFKNTGGLNGKTILMVGDLKRGRTVRSLCFLLQFFKNIKIIFSSSKTLKVSKDIKSFLSNVNISFEETSEFKTLLPQADAIYMTRVQSEYDSSNNLNDNLYRLEVNDLKLLKPTAVILHPLPRVKEISPLVDEDPRAMYWRQVRNGMWTRSALIAKIFKIDKEILNR